MFERKSNILKDGSTLSFDYVPEKVVGRESHMSQLENLFSPLALDGKSCTAFLYGGVGAGKTVTAKRFCIDMDSYFRENGKHMGYRYVNCRVKSSEYSVVLEILRFFDPGFPERGFAIDEILALIKRGIESRREALVIVLDEVDVMLKGTGKNLIYQLTRMPEELKAGSLSLLLISQYPLAMLIDEATMSTFRRSNMVSFAGYTEAELRKIIEYRAGIAFYPGTLPEESVDVLSSAAADYCDARFAIEVLERAAHIAESGGLKEVTPDCIRAASSASYSDLSEEKLNDLDDTKKLILLSIARAIKTLSSISITKCEKTYAIVCEEYNVPPKKHTQYYNHIQDLEKRGLLRTEVRRDPDGGRATFIIMDHVPSRELAKKLEYLLDKDDKGEFSDEM